MPELSREIMAWTAGVLLAVYALGILVALSRKPRQPDPQRGQAIGCLMIVVFALVGLGAVLAAAVIWELNGLIRVVFWIAVFPCLSLLGSGFWHLVQPRRREY
jgi:MFS family permease